MAGKRRGFGKIRQLPSKRHQASYVGPDLMRHVAPSTFDTQLDAEAWLTDIRRSIADGSWTGTTARSRVETFGDYSATWLADRDLKPRTRAHYSSLLDRVLIPAFGDLPVKAITPMSVRAWHADLGNRTPTLRAHSYGLLRTILATAVADELIPVNPCHIRGAGNAKRVHRIKPATLDQLAALVEAMPERLRAMTLLAAWCGLRFGELTELRRKDVDLKRGVLHIRRAVVRVNGRPEVTTPKSAAGTRDVAVPPHLLPLLREHLHEHADTGRDGLLFPAPDGRHLAPASLYGRSPVVNRGTGAVIRAGFGFYGARAAAGRPDLRWHDLRHTGAVLAASTGATLAELMARLGHSTPGAALRYQHAADGRDAEIARRLSILVERQS